MTIQQAVAAPVARLSRRNKIGLAVAGILGLVDTASLLMPRPGPGELGPPVAVLIVDTILGLVTLLAVVYTVRTAARAGARVVAGSRVLSTITALPAFFVPGVPPGLVAVAAVAVVVTLVTVWLVLSPPAPGAR
jgi:hypothetical protein